MSLLSDGPCDRAWAIAEGLIRTGRAERSKETEKFIRVDGIKGACYWVAFDGNTILRGRSVTIADELQPGFVDAMARAGAGVEP